MRDLIISRAAREGPFVANDNYSVEVIDCTLLLAEVTFFFVWILERILVEHVEYSCKDATKGSSYDIEGQVSV